MTSSLTKIMRLNLYLLVSMFLIFAQGVYCQTSDKIPECFSIDGRNLYESKMEIESGNQLFIRAKKELLQNANKALTAGPYSVTFKKVLLMGCSKHDYLSMSNYWWPNPKTKNGLPYVMKDGKVNPERNKIPDAKMTIALGNDVLNLGLAYYFTNDEKYAKHAAELLKVFFLNDDTKMNSNFDYSQIVVGNKSSGGATISATAFIPVVEGVQLIKNSKYLSTNDYRELQNWFKGFLDWMINSKHGKKQSTLKNNIGTYYAVQVAEYSLFVGNNNLAKTVLRTKGIGCINYQINSDGSMPMELKRATPWNYVKYNLMAYDKIVELGKKVDIDLLNYKNPKGGSIIKAFDWVRPFAEGQTNWKYSRESVSTNSASIVLKRSKSLKSMPQNDNSNLKALSFSSANSSNKFVEKGLSYKDILY